MRYRCAWCKCELRLPDGKNDYVVSDGICEKCQQEYFPDFFKKEKRGKEEKNERGRKKRIEVFKGI